MAVTVEQLLLQLTNARNVVRAGVAYSAINEQEGWGVAAEQKDGNLTGRIIVVCHNDSVMKRFIKEASRCGNFVEVPLLRKFKKTVFVTPLGR